MKALATADRMGAQRYVSQQINYTLQAREAEYELIPAGVDQGVGVLVWSRSPAACSRASTAATMTGRCTRAKTRAGTATRSATGAALWRIVDVLVDIAGARGVSAAQVALAWLLARPGVTSLIIGARDEEQLADNLAASELVLSAEEHARLEQVSRPPLLYPYWHQAASMPTA